jgi:hypothetical protein
MSVLVAMNIESASADVAGKPVMGQEWRNGILVPVPLRDDPPRPSRSARSYRGDSEDVSSTPAAPVVQKPNKEQIYREAVQLLKPIGNISETQKYPTRGSVVLRPAGTAFFGILRQEGGQNLESVAQQLGETPFAASNSTAEDLYRTAYLLQAAAKSGGDEDARFLADQAGLAINGQPILVVIPDRRRAGETEPLISRLDQLKNAALAAQASYVQARQSLSAAEKDLAEATSEVEKQTQAVKEAVESAKSSPDPEQVPEVKEARAALEQLRQDQSTAAAAEVQAKGGADFAEHQLGTAVENLLKISVDMP